ncbi:MAG: anion transporter [Magnetococcales bacterium]|nr:anion transporter [Magnetococcales bacterium]
MNRATISVTGATLLVITGAISWESASAAIDGDTIVLLWAMMVVNGHLRRSGFFARVAWQVIGARLPAPLLLGVLMAVSGALSALFLNDTVVLAFTPLVIEVVLAAHLPPLPFLIGLAIAANIGSVATIIGNPQNMIIGLSSGIAFTRFLEALAPVAIGAMVIAWIVVVWLFREMLGWRRSLRWEGRTSSEAEGSRSRPLSPPDLDRSMLGKSLVAASLLVIALLSREGVPLAALGAASLLLISRRLSPESLFEEIDWGLLVFFSGLFVVTGAVNQIGVAPQMLSALYTGEAPNLASLTLVGAALSNLVSNVPAVLLLSPWVSSLPSPETAWLTLAMATTLAGNLTLLGSVANLIVAETARRRGIILGFSPYLRVGLPVTLLTLLWGGLLMFPEEF